MEPVYAPIGPDATPAAADPGPFSAFRVLFAPAATFAGLAKRPRWLAVFLITLIGIFSITYLVTSKIDPEAYRAEIQQTLEKQGLKGAELEQGIDRATMVMEKGRWVILAGQTAFIAVFYLIAAVVFMVAFKLQGSDLTFTQAWSTTLHGFMPSLVGIVIAIPILLGRASISMAEARGGNILASNLGFLAGPETSPAITALLTSADAFSVWCIVLLGLGFHLVGRVSKGSAFGTVGVLWLLAVLVKVGFAALFGQGPS